MPKLKGEGLGVAADHHAGVEAERKRVRDTESFLDLLEGLTTDSGYNWCSDTLGGIYQTVEGSGVVTEGQRKAVENIMKRVEG